ncbi:MAG: ABC transporter ATP-binding protein [Chloroflexota bacterium]|nr:MAG: ABC transporter ATP-binding protein [Chloroflexota bacterium]
MSSLNWSEPDTTLLEVTDLTTRFHTQDGTVHAVNGLNFHLEPGELLGVVGESGSGKSVTMLSLLRLIPMPPGEISAGEAIFNGQDLLQMSPDDIRQVRGGQIGFIFQDPMTSLNPVLTIGKQIMEPLKEHLHLSGQDARDRAIELLNLVGIPSAEDRLSSYPHEFSGGMRQRVMIAIALSCSPQLIIADEPTTALDVTIQAQIIDLMKRLRQELGMSIIWITHDLGVVAGIADRVMVMYGGFIVERAGVKGVYGDPQHPYTRGLLGSLPRLDLEKAEMLTNIKGHPPDLLDPPLSCPFAPRCPFAYERCFEENPPLKAIATHHEIACWWDIDEGEPRYDR